MSVIRGAYIRGGLYSGGLILGILRYFSTLTHDNATCCIMVYRNGRLHKKIELAVVRGP